MPRKNKPRKPRSREKADPLKVEFSLRGKGKIPTAEQARAIFIRWANGGTLPKRIKIKFVRWQNPGRKTEALRNWREAHTHQDILRARRTLRLRGWLSGAKINIAQIRGDRIQGESVPHPTRLRQRKAQSKKTRISRSGTRPKNTKSGRKKRSVSQNKKRLARRNRSKRKTR